MPRCQNNISTTHISSAVINFGIFLACGRLKWGHKKGSPWSEKDNLPRPRPLLPERWNEWGRKLQVQYGSQIKDSQEQDVSIGIYKHCQYFQNTDLLVVSAPVFRLVKISSPNMSESMLDQKCELTCCCCGTTDEKGFFFFSATTASGASTGSSSYCETCLHGIKGESLVVVTTWS